VNDQNVHCPFDDAGTVCSDSFCSTDGFEAAAEASGCSALFGLSAGKIVPAMSYVPVQFFDEVYEADVGLSRGTIFPCLDKPFLGSKGVLQ
jgi:hypothetical protein